EKLAVVMALKSLERCQVALVVVDASEALAAQDAHIAGYTNKAGRAAVSSCNKWDPVPRRLTRKAEVLGQVRAPLPAAASAPVCCTCATRAEGIPELFDRMGQVAAEPRRRIRGGELTEALRAAVARRPASLRGDPLTIQSASQVSVEPPTFALRVNRPNDIHFSYERYLVKSLRHAFGLAGSPIRLSLRKATGSQPRPRRVRR